MAAYDSRDDEPIDERRIDRPADDHGTAQLAHWGGFLTGFLLPLILYATQADKRSFAAWHARQALNFQLSLMIYYAIACAPMCLFFLHWALLLVGLALLIAVAAGETVLIILASLAVSRGERYRYPLTIAFLPSPMNPRENTDYVDRE